MIARDLKQYQGQLVELRFFDGHTVRARIVTVDEDDPQELVYDIVEVTNVGPSRWSAVSAGTVASAMVSELAEFRPMN